jgi:hypothetical protein
MLGVLATELPLQPRASQRNWSGMKITMFGFCTGSGLHFAGLENFSNAWGIFATDNS